MTTHTQAIGELLLTDEERMGAEGYPWEERDPGRPSAVEEHVEDLGLLALLRRGRVLGGRSRAGLGGLFTALLIGDGLALSRHLCCQLGPIDHGATVAGPAGRIDSVTPDHGSQSRSAVQEGAPAGRLGPDQAWG